MNIKLARHIVYSGCHWPIEEAEEAVKVVSFYEDHPEIEDEGMDEGMRSLLIELKDWSNS